jgi:hypothetical protein
VTRRLTAIAALICAVLAIAPPTSTSAQDAGDDAAPTINPWSLRLSAELGAGRRDIDIPREGVVQQIRTDLFPVAGLGFALDHAASDAITVGLLVRYQTSVGLGISEQHTDGSVRPLDVRAHRLELAVAPTLRLDESGSWALAASAGYGLANFRPDAHEIVTPAYSLAGPHLRLELRLAPWDGPIRLRVGPEIQWIAHVGQDLVDRGMASRGLGVGGEAAIEVALGQRWAIGASYREMRSWLDSSQAQSFEDVARFVTASLSGKL